MSALAREKYEMILEEIAKDSQKKNKKRSYTLDRKKDAEKHEYSLMFEFNTALRRVHEKSLSNRKPRYEGPTLEEALAEYYG